MGLGPRKGEGIIITPDGGNKGGKWILVEKNRLLVGYLPN